MCLTYRAGLGAQDPHPEGRWLSRGTRGLRKGNWTEVVPWWAALDEPTWGPKSSLGDATGPMPTSSTTSSGWITFPKVNQITPHLEGPHPNSFFAEESARG